MTQPIINRIERTDVERFRTYGNLTTPQMNDYQQIATKSAIYPGQGTPFGLMYAALGWFAQWRNQGFYA